MPDVRYEIMPGIYLMQHYPDDVQSIQYTEDLVGLPAFCSDTEAVVNITLKVKFRSKEVAAAFREQILTEKKQTVEGLLAQK